MAETIGGSIRELPLSLANDSVDAPVLRTAGYCAGCGTWDEHGPVCVSCGYDFVSSGSPGADL